MAYPLIVPPGDLTFTELPTAREFISLVVVSLDYRLVFDAICDADKAESLNKDDYIPLLV